jgi:hypothetical protein
MIPLNEQERENFHVRNASIPLEIKLTNTKLTADEEAERAK